MEHSKTLKIQVLDFFFVFFVFLFSNDSLFFISQIVVVGNDIDSVHLTSLLKKKVGSDELMTFSPISYEREKQQEPKHNRIQSMVWPAYQASVPYYYTDILDKNQDSCTVMWPHIWILSMAKTEVDFLRFCNTDSTYNSCHWI